MATQEIKSTNWKVFCEKFLELHRGTLMKVRQLTPSGQYTDIVEDFPLTGAWMESEGCNDHIFLRFQQQGEREITHEIIDPIHVKLREESGGQKGLQIDAENGSTLVLFHSGKLRNLLDAVA
jgi:hypothetical protein